MDPFHFACPHCSSRLRVREKLFVGRQVDCPECGNHLLIVERPDGLGVECVARSFDASLSAAPRKLKQTGPKEVESRTSTAGRLRGIISQRRHSLIVLGVAAALIAGTLVTVFYPRTDRAPALLPPRPKTGMGAGTWNPAKPDAPSRQEIHAQNHGEAER